MVGPLREMWFASVSKTLHRRSYEAMTLALCCDETNDRLICANLWSSNGSLEVSVNLILVVKACWSWQLTFFDFHRVLDPGLLKASLWLIWWINVVSCSHSVRYFNPADPLTSSHESPSSQKILVGVVIDIGGGMRGRHNPGGEKFTAGDSQPHFLAL